MGGGGGVTLYRSWFFIRGTGWGFNLVYGGGSLYKAMVLYKRNWMGVLTSYVTVTCCDMNIIRYIKSAFP